MSVLGKQQEIKGLKNKGKKERRQGVVARYVESQLWINSTIQQSEGKGGSRRARIRINVNITMKMLEHLIQ